MLPWKMRQRKTIAYSRKMNRQSANFPRRRQNLRKKMRNCNRGFLADGIFGCGIFNWPTARRNHCSEYFPTPMILRPLYVAKHNRMLQKSFGILCRIVGTKNCWGIWRFCGNSLTLVNSTKSKPLFEILSVKTGDKYDRKYHLVEPFCEVQQGSVEKVCVQGIPQCFCK